MTSISAFSSTSTSIQFTQSRYSAGASCTTGATKSGSGDAAQFSLMALQMLSSSSSGSTQGANAPGSSPASSLSLLPPPAPAFSASQASSIGAALGQSDPGLESAIAGASGQLTPQNLDAALTKLQAALSQAGVSAGGSGGEASASITASQAAKVGSVLQQSDPSLFAALTQGQGTLTPGELKNGLQALGSAITSTLSQASLPVTGADATGGHHHHHHGGGGGAGDALTGTSSGSSSILSSGSSSSGTSLLSALFGATSGATNQTSLFRANLINALLGTSGSAAMA